MTRTRPKLSLVSAIFLCSVSGAAAQTIRFAAFGDYGQSSNSQLVANRVLAMNPDFICTAGDNTYSTTVSVSNWDAAVGQYYKSYIQLPAASAWFAQGSAVNKFFPVLGNHDFDVGNSATSYTNYFIGLPGNKRYYTFTRGPVQFFMLSSDPREPDGVSIGSVQYNWFVQQASASTARWQVAVFHHPFQTSTTSSHAPSAYMNWGFENRGIDMVLQGHNHTMERINYGGITWFVTGAGGRSHYTFTSIAAGSQFRDSTNYGFSMVTADANTLTHQFISAAGAVLDTFTKTQPPACAPNCDQSTSVPVLNANDFACFLNAFAAGDTYANCDGSTVVPVLNANDFLCFLNQFAVGCS